MVTTYRPQPGTENVIAPASADNATGADLRKAGTHMLANCTDTSVTTR